MNDVTPDRFGATIEKLFRSLMQGRRKLDRDVSHQMFALATQSSAAFAIQHMLTAEQVRGAKYGEPGTLDLLELALNAVKVDGFYAEFGVHSGRTISFIAERTAGLVYGFDSFEGLPEDWISSYSKGAFDRGGEPPALSNERIHLRKGWFSETVPAFASEVAAPAAFLHVDSDLYSSAKTVFDAIGDRIVSGTVIVFDEFFNYAGWEQHEAKAFGEFCDASALSVKYLGFTPEGNSVAVQMI